MKINKISILSIGLAALMSSAFAAPQASGTLQAERQQVVKQYLADLQSADYKDIALLFEKDGNVVSTSKGKANAKEFFYGFLPEVVSAHTELHQSFTNTQDPNRTAARFHLNFKLKDGEEGAGEYMDEFEFSPNSSKLMTVYMFENLKFPSGE